MYGEAGACEAEDGVIVAREGCKAGRNDGVVLCVGRVGVANVFPGRCSCSRDIRDVGW